MISEVSRPLSNSTENPCKEVLTPIIPKEQYPLELFHERAEKAAMRKKEMEDMAQREKLMQFREDPKDLSLVILCPR